MKDRILRGLAQAVAASAVLLSAGAALPAQLTRVSSAPPPDWVRSRDWLAAPPQAGNDRSEGVRCLLYERQEHPQREERFLRVIRLMKTEAGVQDSGSLAFAFDPSCQELIFHRVQIHRGGKSLDKLDMSKVRLIQPEPHLDGHVLTGRDTALLFVEDLRVGDVLEYAYTTRGINPLLRGRYSARILVQGIEPVDRQRIRIVWSSAKPLQMRAHLTGVPAEKGPWPGGAEYVWDFSSQAAIPIEDALPAGYEPLPYLEFSDFDDWSQVVEWALPLYAQETAALPSELSGLIGQWRAGASTPEEGARRALQFVQDDLRYTALALGPDSYRPAPPLETFQRRFGDCKAKASLLCVMLRSMGIKAHPVLVDSSGGETLARRLPSPFAFDHVIVKAILEDVTVWVDPTCSHQGGVMWNRCLPPLGKGLVIEPGVTGLENIPLPRGTDAVQRMSSTFTIRDYSSLVDLTVKTTHNGFRADAVREQRARSDPEDTQKRYLNFYARYYPGIESRLPLEISDDRKNNVLIVTEHYRIRNLWKLGDSGRRWEATFYADSLQDVLTSPSTRLRQMPLRLAFPVRREQEIVVHLPDGGWNIPDLVKDVDHEAFFFHYRRKYSGSTVRFRYECETKGSEVPAQNVAGYLSKREEMENLLADTLHRADDSRHTLLARLNWLMVVIAAFGASATLAGFVWVWRLTGKAAAAPSTDLPLPQPGEPQLEGLGGWLFLVGLGLVGTLVSRFVILSRGWEGYFTAAAWQAVATPLGEHYHPLYGPVLVLELLGNIALFGLTALALCLYFAKRRAFPRTYIALLVSGFLFLVVDEVLSAAIPSVAAKSDPRAGARLVHQAGVAVIWIAYMLNSKRVKNTFRR